MANSGMAASVLAGGTSSRLQRVLRQLPMGDVERRAVEAGEIDAVVDYIGVNVIMFPAARRALRDSARRALAAESRANLEMPRRNSLLASLPRADYRRLLPALEPVRLELGDVVLEAGAPVRHVHFPVDCVMCLLTETGSQRAVATGLVGHEGMVGTSLALASGVSSARALVLVAGTALRMPASLFTYEFQRALQLQLQLHRYAQVELDQARQIAACIASHPFEQRLAWWLLMIGDRTGSPEMFLTQENLAAVFNMRRVSVTVASSSLRARGLIAYTRGRISILDHKGLESRSCPCYRRAVPTLVA